MPHDAPRHMLDQLARLRALRGPAATLEARARLDAVLAVQSFQRQRLYNTYADLMQSPRYGPAARFFLDDLYGVEDMSPRDADLERILPVMSRLLPGKGVETVALALEMDALSLEMDHAVAAHLVGKPSEVDAGDYLTAYRQAGNDDSRQRQISLIHEVGERLQSLVQFPLVYSTLRLMRTPAHLAGLGHLQSFLERGASAFKHMHGSHEFLDTIRDRESEIHRRIINNHPLPFGWTA
jgi:hypothetical protein